MLLRFIVCKDERKRILAANHVDPSAGHMCKSRMVARIKQSYTWKGLVSDMIDFVSTLSKLDYWSLYSIHVC